MRICMLVLLMSSACLPRPPGSSESALKDEEGAPKFHQRVDSAWRFDGDARTGAATTAGQIQH